MLASRQAARRLVPPGRKPAVSLAPNDCGAPDGTLNRLAASIGARQRAMAEHSLVAAPPDPPGQIPIGIQARLRSRRGPDLGNVLARMARAHLRFTREDFPWASIEPRPGEYCWAHTDYWMFGAARAGVRVIAVPDASPSWAESTLATAPTDPAGLQAYTAFVREIVGRYGAYGSFWAHHPHLRPDPITYVDVWNEPYIKYFWHRDYPDPEGYANMFEAVVRTVRPIDPEARFLLEADVTAQDGTPFLADVLQAQPLVARDAYAVSTHPYASNGWGPGVCSASETIAARQYQTCRILQLRRTLDDYGAANVRLFITELGWGASGSSAPKLSPLTVARYVTQTFDLLRTRWKRLVSGLIWYEYQASPGSIGPRGDFGLIQPNGLPSPGWYVLATEAARGIPSP